MSKLLSEEPSTQAGADLEYQLLEAAKAGDLELVKKTVLEHPQIGKDSKNIQMHMGFCFED